MVKLVYTLLEGVVLATACEFESHPAHQSVKKGKLYDEESRHHLSNMYDKILSKGDKGKVRENRFLDALAGFFVHLFVIWIVQSGAIDVEGSMGLQEPIDAIYTPFSIILFYEVSPYLLPTKIHYHIHRKQFEIITFITIRGILRKCLN